MKPPSPLHDLPVALHAETRKAATSWQASRGTARLWARDASLWTGQDESNWLGWLDAVPGADLERLATLARAVRQEHFANVLLLGMGGSSLAPEVLASILGSARGAPRLVIGDSTDPEQVRRTAEAVDPANALVVIASKSGSTLEPNLLADFFLDRFRALGGRDRFARHVVAITDPGSSLETRARSNRFRAIEYGLPTVGGRYSALTAFGLVPAALVGIDVPRLVVRARAMQVACRAERDADNPGVALGLVMGAAARIGRDKLTILTDSALAPMAAWLEQLIAESLGKNGRGVVPVATEPILAVERYASDRLFVRLRLDGTVEAHPGMEALRAAGHPVLDIVLSDRYDLGAEFFRWEVATAVAGAVIGVNPFDQPDVESAKVAARAVLQAPNAVSASPAIETPTLALYGATRSTTIASALAEWVDSVGNGDYFALLAFIDRNTANEEALAAMRDALRATSTAAVTVGFGPRYLHSTGQLHKGGSNSGVFLMITAEQADLAIPGQTVGFAGVERAQAEGDFNVLCERGRRALRIHVRGDLTAGLHEIVAMLRSAAG